MGDISLFSGRVIFPAFSLHMKFPLKKLRLFPRPLIAKYPRPTLLINSRENQSSERKKAINLVGSFHCFAMASKSESNSKIQDIIAHMPTIGGTMQRAVLVTAFRGPRNFLSHIELTSGKSKPTASPGHVVVRMKLRSLHPADVLSLMGLYPGFKPTEFPATPGLEGMGVVDSVGPGVENSMVGQRVVPLMSAYAKKGEGSWQEYCQVSSEDLIALPDTISDESAAQMIVNPVTAYGLLKTISPPHGEYILQSAAGSTFGRLVISLAKHWGIKTINIVRRLAQVDELKAYGADEVICSTTEDIVQRVREITDGRMAWGAIDCVAGDMTKTVSNSVRDGGDVYVMGGFSSPTSSVNVGDLIFRNITLKGFWLSNYLRILSAEEKQDVLNNVLSLLEERIIEPFAGDKFDLADFKDALKKQQEEGRGGKVQLSG